MILEKVIAVYLAIGLVYAMHDAVRQGLFGEGQRDFDKPYIDIGISKSLLLFFKLLTVAVVTVLWLPAEIKERLCRNV